MSDVERENLVQKLCLPCIFFFKEMEKRRESVMESLLIHARLAARVVYSSLNPSQVNVEKDGLKRCAFLSRS
jgi:hypothetical protein